MQHCVVSVVDDDPSVREGAADLLNSAGIATESFRNADEFLRSGSPDWTSCLVADMRMPGMSGIELHEQLRRTGRKIPTILITAFPMDSDRTRARETGVWGYLKKPFSEQDFLWYVNSALEGKQEVLFSYKDETTSPNDNDQPAITRTSQAEPLRIEQLTSPDALEAITPDWEKLDAQLSPRTPFTSPVWIKLWWYYLRQERPAIRQEFFVHTVRDGSGELLAIAPLVITHRPGLGPLQLRLLQFFGGADGSITEHRCLICREQDERRIIPALTSYLYDHSEKWDVFAWTGIRHDETAPCRSDPLHVYKKTPYYLVPLPKTWNEFRSGLSPNMKEAIRKCYKNLARDEHRFIFRVVTDPEQVTISLNRLFDLHSERAQFKYAPKHRDLFAKPSHRAFITNVSHRMAEQDKLRLFELEVDGKVVASRLAFLIGDELYLYYSGFDLEWRKYSIMTTLMCECFKWAIERGIGVVNLSKGKDPSKLRWRGNEIEFHDALLISPSARGAVISHLYKLLLTRPGLFVRITQLFTLVWILFLSLPPNSIQS